MLRGAERTIRRHFSRISNIKRIFALQIGIYIQVRLNIYERPTLIFEIFFFLSLSVLEKVLNSLSALRRYFFY